MMMSKTDRSQQALNWLNSEKKKDNLEIKLTKEKIVSEIKKIKKETIFPKPKKLTLWQKVKILLLGN